MSESAKQRAAKRKMKILAHHQGIKEAMPLYFCLVMSCLYQLVEVDREELLIYWKII
jgi:hypothetical protein